MATICVMVFAYIFCLKHELKAWRKLDIWSNDMRQQLSLGIRSSPGTIFCSNP